MAVRLPTYDLRKVFAQRDRIARCVDLLAICEEEMTKSTFNTLTAYIVHMLPPVSVDAVIASCEYLRGRVLEEDELTRLAWRLAGNVSLLKKRPVLPWAGSPKAEWLPLQIVRVDYDVNFKKETAALCTLQTLAGTACPEQFKIQWSIPYIRFISPRLGFSKFGKTSLQDMFELMSMRMFGKAPAGEKDVVFKEFKFSPSSLDWNKRIIRGRLRRNFKCPRNLPATEPCFRCSWGLDRCQVAVREDSMTQKRCKECGNIRMHDPRNDVCAKCDRERKHRER